MTSSRISTGWRQSGELARRVPAKRALASAEPGPRATCSAIATGYSLVAPGSRVSLRSAAPRCTSPGTRGGLALPPERLERQDRPGVLDARDGLHLLVDEMADVGAGSDVE